jgi:phospholipid N-methyltransferase
VNTYSHGLFSWFAARNLRADRPGTAWLAAAGAVLPDVPYLARAAGILTRERGRVRRHDALARLDYYDTPAWTPDLALHSFLPAAHMLGLYMLLPRRHIRTREAVLAFALGWAGHNLVDLGTHASDARPHLWPLTNWRWRSPVSYWERRFHGTSVLVAEHVAVAALAVRLLMAHTSHAPERQDGSRLRDLASLITGFVEHPRQVGALVPTSRATVRAMLDMTDLSNASQVVELGAGTGVYTEELLRRARPDARILAFEIDARLAGRLEERFKDERLQVVNDSAERLGDYVDGEKVDVIVSALPFTTLPEPVRESIYAAIVSALQPTGVMLAIQYSNARRRDLERIFSTVERRFSVRNVPPAVLYACRGPRDPRARDA